jgi:tetratricopeptide (TPR) repeat protein
MVVNPEFVERYQIEYQKNPASKVFAPLAEAYRKMGLIEEAHRISKIGVKTHPHFAGGRVAYAKVLIDLKQFEEGLAQLDQAVQLSPDNLLAHSLMGEALLQLRRPKDALKAFKMVLFLNPHDEKAREAVKKWEFLTADEFENEAFAMKPVFRIESKDLHRSRNYGSGENFADANDALAAALEDIPSLLFAEPESRDDSEDSPPTNTRLALAQQHSRALERAISLADALTVRNDLNSALEVLSQARQLLGHMPEIEKRYELLTKRLEVFEQSEPDLPSDSKPLARTERHRRIKVLQNLLQRINERRVGG